MKTLSFLLLFVLVLVACNSKDKSNDSRPENLIPQEKMARILADIHQAEGIISMEEVSKDSSLLLFTEIENQIFEKYKINKAQFKVSYNWYTSHVKEYKDLYTIVVDTMNVRHSEEKEE